MDERSLCAGYLTEGIGILLLVAAGNGVTVSRHVFHVAQSLSAVKAGFLAHVRSYIT